MRITIFKDNFVSVNPTYSSDLFGNGSTPRKQLEDCKEKYQIIIDELNAVLSTNIPEKADKYLHMTNSSNNNIDVNRHTTFTFVLDSEKQNISKSNEEKLGFWSKIKNVFQKKQSVVTQ